MDHETPTQPLINQQTAVDVGAPLQSQRSSSRAYKVTGLTILACVLIAGQVAIGYFILSQRSDIRELQEQNNKMSMDLSKGRSGGSMSARMHIPMGTMHEMNIDPMDEEASAGRTTTGPKTDCQMEAAGLKPVGVPGFFPKCDKKGFYNPQQCFGMQCWCVNPVTGLTIPGSVGATNCNTSAFPGGLFALSDSAKTEAD